MAETLVKPQEAAANDASQFDAASDMLATRMPNAVKGFGFARPRGVQPLDDDAEIFDRSFKAAQSLKGVVKQGLSNPTSVVKGLSPAFTQQFGHFMSAAGAPGFGVGGGGMAEMVKQIQAAFGELGKNVTLTSPLSSGFVPYDLLAPSRLIYPVYSPLRNKIPRVQGQGTSRRMKVVTGISGSQTGGQGVVDISSSETTNFGTWPNNIPPSGSQTAVDINVPYQFSGLSESLSWLSQFAGQGFEDISALANLILLQEFMLGEEYQILSATPQNLGVPGTPGFSLRTAGSGETPLAASAHFWIAYTAVNYFGETVMGAVSADVGAVANTQVIDVALPAVPGALTYNIYVNNSSAAAPGRAALFQMAANVGGTRFTLQGSVPGSGPTPPATDTGTGKSTRFAGLIPTLSGQAATAGVYPAGWQAGYYQPNLGTHLSINAVNNALQGLWSGTGSFNPGAFRADPSEIIGEGGDLMRLANDVVASGAATNYRLMIDQPEVSGIRAGAAVSEFQNPITRSIIKMLVHPWLTQGTALLMSYSLPFAWSQVSNCFEMTMVQDYLSISWPVIDPTFRYSMFSYGALVASAPQYSGLIQGIEKSDVTPYS
ncbi:hypothetical protein GCM10023196_036990 [Actinoallomurus vinaceus]|uniref:Uncharacterized protein n=1 Tax=Actinoallomurus vinaceus TaxID=1080074 RepID=A0ABP8UAR5_9ACTN